MRRRLTTARRRPRRPRCRPMAPALLVVILTTAIAPVAATAQSVDRAVTSAPSARETTSARAGFPDVPQSNRFVAEITWMAGADITGGFADGTFRPGAEVTRQGMSAFMYRLWLLLGGQPEAVPDPGLTDVGTDHPFYDEIAWMADAGITEGYPDNTFRPAALVSRQAMAAFMSRLGLLLGSTPGPVPDPGLTDVGTDHPFYDEIAWMAHTGITEGYPDNTFRPTESVRRQGMSAFMWRLFDVITDEVCSTQTQLSVGECTALVALHLATLGANWTDADGWMETATPCSWLGITCGPVPASSSDVGAPGLRTPTMTVTHLEIPSNNLRGRFPTQIDSLVSLGWIELYFNAIGGPLPADIGDLPNLQILNLHGNLLSGPLPSELAELPLVSYLTLSSNRFSGSIPPELGDTPSLINLNLNDNMLTGSIPPELGSLDLDALGLSFNQLTGPIPPELAQATEIRWLILNGNQLTGSIPASFGAFTEILTLAVADNELSGPLPTSLTNLTTLTNVQLSGNGCFTAATPALTSFLDTHAPLWDDGCP